MLDSPIVVSGKALPENILKGTVKGPIVVPYKLAKSDAGNAAFGINSSVYKVRMVANGKTFNMLLPPSIESKHPGRSNPLQLPGLQIKAGMSISKLKIPGFFPIYQHLGVESLTISMSGMFTGYDGTDSLSTASNWEQDLPIKESQDAYASANEFYDFAVKSKSLIEVNIFTSDGSFIPKNSTSTTFRDSSSNIKFKGYVKEIEQVYVRQDRVYYMIRFEIIDVGNTACKTTNNKLINNKLLADTATKGLKTTTSSSPITDLDRKYRPKEDIEQAEKIKALIDRGASIEEIRKELSKIFVSVGPTLETSLLLYAEEKGYSVDSDLNQVLNDLKTYTYRLKLKKITDEKSKVINALFYNNALFLCNRFNDSCNEIKDAARAQRLENAKFENGTDPIETNSPIVTEINIDPIETNPPIIYKEPSNISKIELMPLNKQANDIRKNYPNAFKNEAFLYGGTSIQAKGSNLGNGLIKENLSLFNPDKDAYAYIGNNDLGEPLFTIYRDVVIIDRDRDRAFSIGASYQNAKNIVVRKKENTQNNKIEYELLSFRVIE